MAEAKNNLDMNPSPARFVTPAVRRGAMFDAIREHELIPAVNIPMGAIASALIEAGVISPLSVDTAGSLIDNSDGTYTWTSADGTQTFIIDTNGGGASLDLDNGISIGLDGKGELGGKLHQATEIEGDHTIHFKNNEKSSLAGQGTVVGSRHSLSVGEWDLAGLTSESSLSVGGKHASKGLHNFQTGTSGSISGQQNLLAGDSLSIEGTANALLGQKSTITGDNNTSLGADNKIEGLHNTALGAKITVNKDNNAALGTDIQVLGNEVVIAGKGQRLGFFNGNRNIKATGIPADATNAASTQTLLNWIKKEVILAYGLAD